jgi:hypothetical protein
MINSIGDRVKTGETFEPGKGYADIIGNFDLQFLPCIPATIGIGSTAPAGFTTMIQTHFPSCSASIRDMKGKFPWEPGCEQWASTSSQCTISPKWPT